MSDPSVRGGLNAPPGVFWLSAIVSLANLFGCTSPWENIKKILTR